MNLPCAKVDRYRFILMALLLLGQLMFHTAEAQYHMEVKLVEGDSLQWKAARIQTSFKSMAACRDYVEALPAQLRAKGFAAASVDSVRYDSTQASLQLYLGKHLQWLELKADSVDKNALDNAGWNPAVYRRRPVDLEQLKQLEDRLLNYYENNGYPFAKISIDSLAMDTSGMAGILRVDKGPLYKIDSIRNYGNAQLSNRFLQRYLNILNGSYYQKDKLLDISRKLNELPFVKEQQRWDISYLGTGSVLNVYLQPKKSSQVNVLLGFLPATQQSGNIYEAARTKLQFTGEATVNLRNALGNGETMLLNWQQIQRKSPRLNLAYQQPYLFGSAFGIQTSFDLFKKDSSFQNINFLLGAQYTTRPDRTGTVFLQTTRSYLLTVDTFYVKNNHQLPNAADMGSVNLGISYDWNATNYRYNPRKGNEWQVLVSAGSKKIRKNNVIVQLKDEQDPTFDFNSLYDTVKLKSYQFRLTMQGAHYFPLSRSSTVKAGLHTGWYQSPAIYRNDLFQIGGYKLLRGFDEESIYASFYSVVTAEYRYLIGMNSYFAGFIDGGYTSNQANGNSYQYNYLGMGLGLAFETKAGIFNIAYAVGKRNDQALNLRQSKIHLGFLSYF